MEWSDAWSDNDMRTATLDREFCPECDEFIFTTEDIEVRGVVSVVVDGKMYETHVDGPRKLRILKILN